MSTKSTIKQLPTKVDLADSDSVMLQDTTATVNTPLGRLGDYLTEGLADGLTVDNGKLYLTREGDITNINNGINIILDDATEFATTAEMHALWNGLLDD